MKPTLSTLRPPVELLSRSSPAPNPQPLNSETNMPPYRDIRTSHFAQCSLASQHPAEAHRMHRAILRVAARHGARQFCEARHRAAIVRACMIEARVPMLLPTLLAPIPMELLKLLLPIVMKWVFDMAGSISPEDPFSASADVDRDLTHWASEAD